MADTNDKPTAEPVKPDQPPTAEPKVLTPEARRALSEAAARRRQAECQPDRPNETGGRPGPDPVRYGDWEKGGIASDF